MCTFEKCRKSVRREFAVKEKEGKNDERLRSLWIFLKFKAKLSMLFVTQI